MKTRAIYVQGCARSGNTLMRELCAASFRGAELVKVNEQKIECNFDFFIDLLRTCREKNGGGILVASRNRRSSLFMDMEMFRANSDLGVIWMLRNPLDLLTSVHKRRLGFYVPPYRLIASINLYNQFKNEPGVLTVRYEDLVSKPEAVQSEIAAKFGFDPVRNFSESHELFPALKQTMNALHSVRPIDSQSVNKWKKKPAFIRYLATVLRDYPELIPLAASCGYDVKVEAEEVISAMKALPPKRFWKRLTRAVGSKLRR